jgi:chromosome segregation protein
MDQTRQNLLRVSDIIAEIDRTRSSLKRQAAKAERFVSYREELEELMLHQSTHQLLEMIVVERVHRESLDAALGRAGEERTRVEEDEAALVAAREEAGTVEDRSELATQAAFRADNDVSALTGELTRARDQLAHLDERMRSSDKEHGELVARRAGLLQEHEDLETRIASLDADAVAREADAAREDEALASLKAEEAAADQVAQSLRLELSEATTGAATVKAKLDALEQRIEETRTRRDRNANELERVTEEVSNLTAYESALRRSVADREEGKRLSAAELGALESELEGLRPQAREAERVLDTAKNDLGLKRNRLRALEDLHRRLEGVGTGVRALLSSGDCAVQGMVADRLEVAEEHTAALAGLLGDRLQCVIVSDPERGLALLDQLRSSGRGRATVAPQSPRYIAGARRPLPEGLSLGYFVDSIRHAPEHETLVRTLVGDAVLCETPALAVEVVRRVPGSTAVSLDGTVVRPDGLISGGSSDDVASGMVEQKREMRILAEEVERLDRHVQVAAETQRSIRARMTELGTSLERARAGAVETEIAHVSAEKDLSRTVSDMERAGQRRTALDAELGELAITLETALSDEASARNQLDLLSQKLDHAKAALERASAGAASWKERVAAHAGLVTEQKVRLAQVREQLGSARAAADRLATSITEHDDRIGRLEQEGLEAAAAFGRTAAEMVSARERRLEADRVAAEAHREHDEVRRLLEEIRYALGEKETSLRTLRAALASSEEQGREHELKLQKLEIERDFLLSSVREKFRGLDLRRVVGKYHMRPAVDAEHRRRVDELAKLIERMGPVNLDAKAEFEDAEKRYVDLTQQKDDIEKALVDLERAIKHMNRESKRRFKETFDAVNELFRKTFRDMFSGGRAELHLTNPEDLLETGVDIVAQPPGKKLGNIELMSGGEKALTATALIFAIFRHRPSPFCVLDEVDAPLDEANVKRYNDAIRGMTERSQFILITHIKSTMQSVDVLYGVTMGEPGVSRIVSVKVNEAAQSRSERKNQLEEAPASEPADVAVA